MTSQVNSREGPQENALMSALESSYLIIPSRDGSESRASSLPFSHSGYVCRCERIISRATPRAAFGPIPVTKGQSTLV